MANIRKAHSVEILDRRLRDCETSGMVDAMELIGIHDELTRVERKWREKQAGMQMLATTGRARPLANAAQMNARFERLRNLINATLRQSTTDDQFTNMLRNISESLKSRAPLRE